MPGPIILDKIAQGSQEWLEARVGCVTMSNAATLLAKGKGGEESTTKRKYYLDVASEILSGVSSDRINTWDMQRGTLLEPYAREAYERVTGNKITQVGLGYWDEKRRISASPDGLHGVTSAGGGLEIKCRGPKAHLQIIEAGHDDKATIAQIQGNMMIFRADAWDYVSFCPEFTPKPIFIHTVWRDDELIEQILTESLKAVREIDKIVAHICSIAKNGIQDICDQALEIIAINQGDAEAGIF